MRHLGEQKGIASERCESNFFWHVGQVSTAMRMCLFRAESTGDAR